MRSFGRALTMEYLDSPRVRIYIHDSAKDIFYELENLSEIRDRTILKLFETDGSGRGPSGANLLLLKQMSDLSFFLQFNQKILKLNISYIRLIHYILLVFLFPGSHYIKIGRKSDLDKPNSRITEKRRKRLCRSF